MPYKTQIPVDFLSLIPTVYSLFPIWLRDLIELLPRLCNLHFLLEQLFHTAQLLGVMTELPHEVILVDALAASVRGAVGGSMTHVRDKFGDDIIESFNSLWEGIHLGAKRIHHNRH
jgi:hypothetical protein